MYSKCRRPPVDKDLNLFYTRASFVTRHIFKREELTTSGFAESAVMMLKVTY